MRGKRKLIFSILGLVIITGAFLLIILRGNNISEGMFGIFIGAICGIIGIYTEGNVRSKKANGGTNG